VRIGLCNVFRVGCPNDSVDVGNCLSFNVKIADAEQSDEAIRLDGDRLIELWGQSKVQLQHVVFNQLVSRVPMM